jgi:hypothetical protein
MGSVSHWSPQRNSACDDQADEPEYQRKHQQHVNDAAHRAPAEQAQNPEKEQYHTAILSTGPSESARN